MKQNMQKMVEKRKTLKDCHDDIDFQTEFVKELCQDTGYSMKSADAQELFHTWEYQKDENILTYRDQRFASIFTGTLSPEMPKKWSEAFDDSIEAFTSCE